MKRSSGKRIRLTIKGQPYIATFLEATDASGPCYRVTAASSKTDNIHRSYIVYVDEAGRALRCNCPSCRYNSNPEIGMVFHCKHMTAVETMTRPADPQ